MLLSRGLALFALVAVVAVLILTLSMVLASTASAMEQPAHAGLAPPAANATQSVDQAVPALSQAQSAAYVALTNSSDTTVDSPRHMLGASVATVSSGTLATFVAISMASATTALLGGSRLAALNRMRRGNLLTLTIGRVTIRAVRSIRSLLLTAATTFTAHTNARSLTATMTAVAALTFLGSAGFTQLLL